MWLVCEDVLKHANVTSAVTGEDGKTVHPVCSGDRDIFFLKSKEERIVMRL